MPETWYAVELNTEGGETYHAICRDADALATYVRVNSGEMASMKVSAVDPSTLAQSRITETFADA